MIKYGIWSLVLLFIGVGFLLFFQITELLIQPKSDLNIGGFAAATVGYFIVWIGIIVFLIGAIKNRRKLSERE